LSLEEHTFISVVLLKCKFEAVSKQIMIKCCVGS